MMNGCEVYFDFVDLAAIIDARCMPEIIRPEEGGKNGDDSNTGEGEGREGERGMKNERGWGVRDG